MLLDRGNCHPLGTALLDTLEDSGGIPCQLPRLCRCDGLHRRLLLHFVHSLEDVRPLGGCWKIQRDVAERGWTKAQVQESIEARKPDFKAYVEPQMQHADIVIEVKPSEISKRKLGTHLKVDMIQRTDKVGLDPVKVKGKYPEGQGVRPKVAKEDSGNFGVELCTRLATYRGRPVRITSMDGKVENVEDYKTIETYLSHTSAKYNGEISSDMIKVGPSYPGALDGSGLFQVITALKLREFYEKTTGLIIDPLEKVVCSSSE